jgi:PAS domain S-box-containing protein
MNLRTKIVLVIVVFVAGTTALFYGTSSSIFLRGFKSIEDNKVRENVTRARQALADMIDQLGSTALDWASWDDTYAFMGDSNQQYIDSNLTDAALAAIRVNLIAFVRPSGELVYDQGVDLESKQRQQLPADLGDRLSALAPLLQAGSASNGVKGILLLAEGPILLAARPILTSRNTGPSRGSLIFGRYLAKSEMQQISRYIDGSLEIRGLDESHGPQVAHPELAADETAVVVHLLNAQQIAGDAVLRDIAGHPALALRVDMPRSIHDHAQAILRVHVTSLLVLSFVCGLILFLMVNKVVLARVSRLADRVGRIGAKGVSDAHVAVEGSDELANLAIQINHMLDTLRQSEKALRVSEERLNHALDAANEGLWEWNVKTGAAFFSPRYCTMLGYEPGELPESYSTWVDMLHPDDRESIVAKIQEDIRQKADGYKLEFRMKRKSGEWRWILSRAKVIERDTDGNTVRLVGVHVDITESKRAEDEIRRLNEQLEQRVLERTAQLETANKELESFSYSVSHDLRAPLRAIDGFSQAVIEECQGKLSADADQNLTRVRAAAQRMARLIDSMLSLSRLSRRELRRERVDLSRLARTILQETQKKNPGRDVSIVIEDGMIAEGDSELMRIVLENLLENAWKFTSRHAQATIEFGETTRDGRQAFFVRDDGAGFDMAYADKLFGAFQRLHSEKEFEGTGIGLAIVQRIIHRHGGKVWAEGEMEKGATFYFTI